jgi:Holliday junction resolvasome RuvABC endonuclease subunit
MILGVRDAIAPDAADALAAAICHAHERTARELLRAATVTI